MSMSRSDRALRAENRQAMAESLLGKMIELYEDSPESENSSIEEVLTAVELAAGAFVGYSCRLTVNLSRS